MNRTGFLYDERYQLHLTGDYHPEVPARLACVYRGIQEAGLLSQLIHIKASRADMKWIERVHDGRYIQRFEAACLSGKRMFDNPDNQMCYDTYETALLAVGGVLDVAGRVMQGELDNGFCAVRPPGHHAEVAKAMGFCYFNNVAIAARYLQKQWGIQRVALSTSMSIMATEPSTSSSRIRPYITIPSTSILLLPIPVPDANSNLAKTPGMAIPKTHRCCPVRAMMNTNA